MMEARTRTFLCGDLFTQGGGGEKALTESDIFGPSEAFRAPIGANPEQLPRFASGGVARTFTTWLREGAARCRSRTPS